MSIKMVREPSESPNITNIDDIIPFRYAYGNQNGYVKNKGNEANYSINGLQFTIQSGRLVLQGVECDISASGVTIEIDTVNELRYYSIYLRVNLALNTATILSQYDTADYPTIEIGDDLTENSSGIANLVLYHFTTNNGIISNVEKLVQEIIYINKSIKVDNATNSDLIQNVNLNSSTPAVFGDYIISKKKPLGIVNFTFNLPLNTTSASTYNVNLTNYPLFKFEPNKKYAIEVFVNASQTNIPSSSLTYLSKPSECNIRGSAGFVIDFQGMGSGFPDSSYPYLYNIRFEQYSNDNVLNYIGFRVITYNNEKSSNDAYIHIIGVYEIIE